MDTPNVYSTRWNSFALGEKESEEKVVRKILRSLSKRFDMKVIAIEKTQDISSIKMDELIGSLLIFEIAINDRSQKKNKGFTFKVDVERYKEHE